MLANTYYEKALSNFKTAKIVFNFASDDEEQLNIVGYHLQQAIELAIKHILALNGVPFQKTHDIDQLINIADLNNIELYLPDYIKEKADTISLWESKTRYVMGYKVELNRISRAIEEVGNYFDILKDIEIL
mgnify:CR=1 FL=1